jgi:hypothetical protein
LWAVDLESGISRVDELLEYCKALRSGKEVQRFMGLTGAHARNYYLNPLIEQGRLRKQTQGKADRKNVFYLNTEVDLAENIGDAIAQYCETPRLLRDITIHFAIDAERLTELMKPLIESGKLIGNIENLDDKEKNGASYKKRYFMSEIAMRKKGDAIMEFCGTPRSRDEIAEFLGAGWKYYFRYLQPLINSGRLALTKPDQLKSRDQRFVAADKLGDSNIKIISEARYKNTAEHPERGLK